MVTPEMMLWLAGKMGIKAEICDGACIYFNSFEYGDMEYRPHLDHAQFGRLVVWAWQEGIVVDNRGRSILTEYDGGPTFIVDHDSTADSTEAGIMAASVVAIARATGYEEPTHER